MNSFSAARYHKKRVKESQERARREPLERQDATPEWRQEPGQPISRSIRSMVTHVRFKFTDDDCQELVQRFTAVTPTMQKCRDYLSEKGWGDVTAKKLQDKIRYLLKKANARAKK